MRLPEDYVRLLNAEYPNKFRIFLDARGMATIEPVGNVQIQRAGRR